jgi:hypothetical protein
LEKGYFMELELEPLEESERATFEEDKEKGPEFSQYDGPDRRIEQRRAGHDRRDQVRFEGGKDDRRSGKDRRKGNISWDDFHSI